MRNALLIALIRLLKYISTINSFWKNFDLYDHYAACCVAGHFLPGILWMIPCPIISHWLHVFRAQVYTS